MNDPSDREAWIGIAWQHCEIGIPLGPSESRSYRPLSSLYFHVVWMAVSSKTEVKQVRSPSLCLTGCARPHPTTRKGIQVCMTDLFLSPEQLQQVLG